MFNWIRGWYLRWSKADSLKHAEPNGQGEFDTAIDRVRHTQYSSAELQQLHYMRSIGRAEEARKASSRSGMRPEERARYYDATKNERTSAHDTDDMFDPLVTIAIGNLINSVSESGAPQSEPFNGDGGEMGGGGASGSWDSSSGTSSVGSGSNDS